MNPMMVATRLLPALLALAAVGCGGADASTTASGSVERMRAAAVRLVLVDANATALAKAYDADLVRRRMRRYVASAWLDRRAAESASAIAQLGGKRYFQVWTEAITVGRWERERRTDSSATVAFLGYETICPTAPPADLPMERFTVRMVHERGRWRLAAYEKRWLTGAGPMGESGKLTLRALPERAVFHSPRPRGWTYGGPHFPGLVPCPRAR